VWRVFLLGLVAAPGAASAARPLTQPLIDFVSAVRTFMPREGSLGYVVPTPEERAAFKAAAAALLAGDVAKAEQAIAGRGNFEVLDFRDGDAGPQYWALAEIPPLTRGWGFYFVARSARRPSVVVEAPHPLADEESELSAARLVQRLRPRAFCLAGAHRYADPARTSDVAHTTTTIFEAVHEALLPTTDLTLQVHGFADATHPGYPDLLLSNATAQPDGRGRAICEAVSGAGLVCTLFDGTAYTDLGATTNVQAAASQRALGANHFLHFETTERMRKDPASFDALAAAIAGAVPEAPKTGCAAAPGPTLWALAPLVAGCRRGRSSSRRRTRGRKPPRRSVIMKKLALTLLVLASACGAPPGGGGDGGSGADGGVLSGDAALYAQAVSDYKAARYQVARGEFSTLLTTYPASSFRDASQVYVGEADYQLKSYAAARSELEAFLAAHAASPEADRATYWLGRTRHAQKDVAAALAIFQGFLTTFAQSNLRDNAQLWVGRSFYDLTPPDYANALVAFRKVISDYGRGASAPEAQYWIGRTEFQMVNYAQARADLESQLTTYGATNAFADAVTVYLGRCDFETLAFAAAQARLDGVPASFPTSKILDEASYWDGRARFEQLDYAGALSQFQHLITTWPQSLLADNAQYWTGRVYFAQLQYAQSLSALQAGETNYPMSNVRDWMVHYQGRCQFELNQPALARPLFDRQLSTWATSQAAPAGHYWRGRTLYGQGTFADAITDFNAVLGTTSSWAPDAHAYKVRAYADQADCANADAAYAAFKTAFPSSPLLATTCAYFRPTTCAGTCP